MKHLISFSFCFLFFTNISFGQELSWVASNKLGKELVAHTLRVKTNVSDNPQIKDTQPVKHTDQIDKVLHQLRNQEGVTRATYDAATETITLLSDQFFDAKLYVRTIRNTKTEGKVKR